MSSALLTGLSRALLRGRPVPMACAPSLPTAPCPASPGWERGWLRPAGLAILLRACCGRRSRAGLCPSTACGQSALGVPARQGSSLTLSCCRLQCCLTLPRAELPAVRARALPLPSVHPGQGRSPSEHQRLPQPPLGWHHGMGLWGCWQCSGKAVAPRPQRVLAALPAPGCRLCLTDTFCRFTMLKPLLPPKPLSRCTLTWTWCE